MLLLWKVISGFFAASKKSGDWRCLSRLGSSVSMLAVLMWKSTEDFSRLAGSRFTLPAKSLKRPRTLVSRWRTWNETSEWPLSIEYTSARTGSAARAVRAMAVKTLRIMMGNLLFLIVGTVSMGAGVAGANNVQQSDEPLLVLT